METKILVVDDDKDICRVISRDLSEQGYKINCVYTGSDAVSKIKNEHYDLLIIDLLLPDVIGTDLVKKIREFNNESKIIILTANPSTETVIQTLRNGISDYITKPYDSAYLRTVIKNVIDTTNENLVELKELGNRIKQVRLEKDLTITEVAAKTDLSKSFISMLERGHKFATLNTLLRIAKELDFDLKFMLRKFKNKNMN